MNVSHLSLRLSLLSSPVAYRLKLLRKWYLRKSTSLVPLRGTFTLLGLFAANLKRHTGSRAEKNHFLFKHHCSKFESFPQLLQFLRDRKQIPRSMLLMYFKQHCLMLITEENSDKPLHHTGCWTFHAFHLQVMNITIFYDMEFSLL